MVVDLNVCYKFILYPFSLMQADDGQKLLIQVDNGRIQARLIVQSILLLVTSFCFLVAGL